MFANLRSCALALAISTGLAACAHSKIPETNIDDTPENRAILEVVAAYHKAFESRDADALLALISPRFYEDNGNTDRSDDYDLRGLREQLVAEFDKTKAVQLDMKVDDIVVEDDEEKAYAFISFTNRAQVEFPVGTKWKTNSDRARLEFERQGDRWLIVGGL